MVSITITSVMRDVSLLENTSATDSKLFFLICLLRLDENDPEIETTVSADQNF